MANAENKTLKGIKSIAATGQKSISYELVNLEHGMYSVGKLPTINTQSLTTNEVNYLVSIKWPHIKIL
jgi:hypothetical protein